MCCNVAVDPSKTSEKEFSHISLSVVHLAWYPNTLNEKDSVILKFNKIVDELFQ